MAKIREIHLRLNEDIYKKIENISNASGDSFSEITRVLINKGLAIDTSKNEIDFISSVIREQLEIILRPQIDRLASISSKATLMSAEATFLNVQALLDLVDTSKRKNVLTMYENARKKAVDFLKGNNGTDIRGFVKDMIIENEVNKNINK